MRKIPIITLSLVLGLGCAADSRERAREVASVAKVLGDNAAALLTDYVDAKAAECGEIVMRAELDACLGPVASHPDEVEAAIDTLEAAQEAISLALAEETPSSEDIAAAVAKLTDAISQIADLVKAAKDD